MCIRDSPLPYQQGQLIHLRSGNVLDLAQPGRVQLGGQLRTHRRQPPVFQRPQEPLLTAPLHLDETMRLAQLAGDLGHQLVRPHPDRNRQLQALGDGLLNRRSRLPRPGALGSVEIQVACLLYTSRCV